MQLLHHLTFLFVKPADAATVVMRLEEQLSEELPQVDGLAGVVTHHIWPGIIISCWQKQERFSETSHTFFHFTLFYLSILISETIAAILINKNLPDLLSSGGQRSFIAAAKETDKKQQITLEFTPHRILKAES